MKKIALISVFCILLIGCSKDKFHYPDALTNLVEADTDNQGNLKLIRTDEGEAFKPSTSVHLKDATPDSTYRVLCMYQSLEHSQADIYKMNGILCSSNPIAIEDLKEDDLLSNDPVKLTSIWCSSKYVNLRLGVMTKDEEKQISRFILTGKHTTAGGQQAFHLQLSHDQNNDPEAYTKDCYLSCPLKTLEPQKGDSIYFTLHTYEGVSTTGFQIK